MAITTACSIPLAWFRKSYIPIYLDRNDVTIARHDFRSLAGILLLGSKFEESACIKVSSHHIGQDVIICSYRGVEEVHGVAVEEEERDDDGGGHDGAPEHVLRSRSLHSLGNEFHLVQSELN